VDSKASGDASGHGQKVEAMTDRRMASPEERDVFLETLGPMLATENILPMLVVYDHPADEPERIVVRRHDVTMPGGGTRVWGYKLLFLSIDDARTWITQRYPHLYRLPRHPSDEPQIVEVWL
jgi:hypothetical protein